jgi:D-alanine-D-alanine ligase
MRKRTDNATEFGRVAVIYGGWSSERQVSLWSGEGVIGALQSRSVDVTAVDADREAVLNLKSRGFDRVFLILHGTGGEDGTVQAALELQGIPYTGSGVLASALGMDKLRTKRMWKAEGLPTPDWLWLRSFDDAQRAGAELGFPLFIKPSEEGSSVGVSKVKTPAHIAAAFAAARGDDDRAVMAERFVACGPAPSGEYTCAILDGAPLPLIRIEPASEFYDYNAKYLADDTRYVCPAGLPPELESEIQTLCLRAYELVACRGWGRVDFMLDAALKPWLIEVNTAPGMTSHSLVPMAAKVAGMDYADLCWAILETTLAAGATPEPGR